MTGFLHHLFLPHTSNNHRAKLLHHESILFLVALFFVGALLIGSVKHSHPQVLGTSINMSVQDLLQLTNVKRQEAHVPALVLNSELDQAAQAKAANMLAENYWAHNSPSGKTPWDFIHAAGYNYIYAGENLARGFTTAQDTVNAWMASPDHRANVLSPNYTDVGFAVVQGNLTGDTNTVLVVEEFGSTTFAKPPTTHAVVATQGVAAPTPTGAPLVIPTLPVLGNQGFQALSVLKQSPLINTALWAKVLAIGLLVVFVITFMLDFVIVGKKQIVRIVGHNLDHILFLITLIFIAYFIGQGIIF